MPSPISNLRTIHAVAPSHLHYLGHFTSAGVGESPFAIIPAPDEIRNTLQTESQHALLQLFAGAADEVLNGHKYGDLRAKTPLEFA